MDLGLTGRTARVVGASKGIGRAIAEVLSREGARVCLVARRSELLAVDGAVETLRGHRHPRTQRRRQPRDGAL